MPTCVAAAIISLLTLCVPVVADDAGAKPIAVAGFEDSGVLMIPVGEVFKPLGCAIRWDPQTDAISITSADRSVSFDIGQARARSSRAGQSRTIDLARPPRYVGRALHGPLEGLCTGLGLALEAVTVAGDTRSFRIDGRLVTVQVVSEMTTQIIGDATGSVVKLETDRGDIYLTLYDNRTPITVGNFLDLVQRGFYDGLNFHRVISHFMIQGGCPLGTGYGDPGFTIPDEADRGIAHRRGSLSMAKLEPPNTGSCQFFICHVPCSHLDGIHTVFGHCVEGMDVVDAIQAGDKIRKATILLKSPHADELIEKAVGARVNRK